MIISLKNVFRVTLISAGLLLNVNKAWAAYCTPDFGYGPFASDYIDGVELGDISNFTGMGDEYNDYTDLSTLLAPGLTYNLTLYNTPSYTEYYAAWIDWNQDETFSDDERLNPDDLIVAPGASGVITFTAPFGALPGTTRMRIMCVYYPAATIESCGAGGAYFYGETEDYSINIPAAGPYDLGVTAINDLESGCGLGITPLSVNITNLGTEPSGAFQIAYQVTDPVLGVLPIVTETYAGAVIPSLITIEYTFATSINLSNLGDYSIVAYTIYALDIEPADDTSDVSLISIPTVATYPYYQDFEDGSGGWLSGGSESSWELGDPSGFAIYGPPPATPASLNSWTTSLTGYYNLNEKSYVESPCLDFTSLLLPFIEMDINYDAQLYDDGAKMQYSTDGGATWADLGGIGTGENWYNHNAIYAMWPAFYIDDYDGWSGNSIGWLHAYQDLTFLAGQPSVKLRIVFASSSYWNFNDGFAFDNVWIGDPYPNDLGVSGLVDPTSGPFLSAAETVTVEVTNYGTLTQTGFPVSYRLDGGAITTETYLGLLAAGESGNHTFATFEDLSVDGDYEFVAWTGLAIDEDFANDTLTTIVSNLLPITGSGAYYIYSNVTGFEPWYTVSNDAHMNDVFGAGEWTTDFYETVDPAALFSGDNCFIFMEGSDSHADELELFLNTNITLIENWVASGGHLLLNAGPNEGDGMNFGFGGTHLNYAWYSGNVAASDPAHPIWSGPFTPTVTSMTGGSYGHATISGDDLTNILYDLFNPDKIIAAEKSWGAGTVIFGGMTVTDYHGPLTEAGNFRKNVISYLAACTISDNDVGVQSIISPSNGCGLTDSEPVIIKVKNYGFMPQTNIPVNYQVDGGGIVSAIVPGTLDVGATVDYTFATTADLAALGSHIITAWTSLGTDTIVENDTTIKTILNVPYITSFPYLEDWESGDEEGWTAFGSNSTWELGYPDGPVINTPPVATPSSQYSWATSLTAEYLDNESSYLESPCFDLTTLVLPYVEVDLWWVTEDYWDGLQLEYSTDGVTWSLLGGIGTGDNWYTNYAVALTYEYGWVGTGPGWVTAHHDVTFLAGQPLVKFRFRFAADAIFTFDGIGLDNFRLQDPFPNDIGVTDLVTPFSGVGLTTVEVVTINVRNFGTLPQSGFPVNYQVDGGAVITETFVGTVNPGTTEPFTFATTADLSALGLHDVCAWTSLVGDEDATNDEIPGCQIVANLAPVAGTGSYYIYSSAVGYEPGYLNSNSTAMDEVFGVDGWILDYYESIDPYEIFSSSNCFIFLEGSESHWSEFETFFGNNKELIEGWVSSGGNLFINASPWEGDGGDVGFGGVTVSYPWYTYYTEATDPLHPVLSGPFSPVTADLYGFYIGYARTTGDITPIINDLYCADCYLLGEKVWGDGRVMFGNMSAPEYYTPTLESQNLRQNIIDYLKLCTPVDLGVTALIAPDGGCGMTASEIVTIEITNFGPTTVNTTPVKYQVDGGGVVAETAPGPIPAGDTYVYSFTTTANLLAVGSHTIDAWTDFSGDEDETNDLLSTDLTSLATPVIDLGPNMTVCDIVTLDAANIGSTYLWSTGATTQTIDVTVSGTYTVTITNPTSGCAVTDNITVTVNYTPIASFTYSVTGLTVTFNNESTDGATYNWSFGDGGTSTAADPSHTYAVAGSYTVTVTVTNGCGSDFFSLVIEVGTGVNDITLAEFVEVYPNPTSDITVVTVDLPVATNLSFELVNTLGQTVWSAIPGTIASGSFTIDMSGLASGVYQLNIIGENETAVKQIILTK